MSEKRAKRERKEFETGAPASKKRNIAGIVSNIVIVILIAAVAGLGIYATWDKIEEVFAPAETQEIQTVADVAAEEGMTAEELLEKCGMTELGLTGESSADDMYTKFTIESYAKYEDKTPEQLKEENGIQDLPNDMNWAEASMKIPMSAMAEQNGMSFEEFAEQSGLPDAITPDMTYEDAMKVIQEQAAAQQAATAE